VAAIGRRPLNSGLCVPVSPVVPHVGPVFIGRVILSVEGQGGVRVRRRGGRSRRAAAAPGGRRRGWSRAVGGRSSTIAVCRRRPGRVCRTTNNDYRRCGHVSEAPAKRRRRSYIVGRRKALAMGLNDAVGPRRRSESRRVVDSKLLTTSHSSGTERRKLGGLIAESGGQAGRCTRDAPRPVAGAI